MKNPWMRHTSDWMHVASFDEDREASGKKCLPWDPYNSLQQASNKSYGGFFFVSLRLS